MPRSSEGGPSEISVEDQAAARIQINHIVGYSGILGEDALETSHEDLTTLYASIADLAVELRKPLSTRLVGGRGASGDGGELDKEIYGLLYDLIARIQGAKDAAASAGCRDLASDTSRLLESANAILELVAALGDTGEVEEEEEPAPQLKDLADQEVASAPGRILVVAGNVFNREILSRHLERQGHSVRVAADGISALELLRSESFDVAIIDVMMPGLNGYQLLERIKADEALQGVRPIVISSLTDTRMIARCIQLGAEDYLPREFEPVILKARIESCLEKKRMREEQELYVAALVDAREKLEEELRDGAAYVRSLLPEKVSLPDLAVDWEYIPSASLGGDAFGYHLLGDGASGPGKFALYLIDVSGHGIEAALFSVTLMNMLKPQILPGADFADPASVLAGLNASFRMEEQNYLFFTAWCGVWDPAARELSYASAGSPPAVLVVPDGSYASLSGGGTIVGVGPDSSYETKTQSVPPGSSLYVFSDGIFEFRAHDGTIFGLERFVRLLAGAAAGGERGPALRRILDCARAECSTERFPDDVSFLEVRLG